MNKIRGQPELANRVNNVDPTDTIDNETSIETIKTIKENIELGESDFWSLCPILLYQLAASNPLERSGCITTALFTAAEQHGNDDHHYDHDHVIETDRKMGKTRQNVYAETWLARIIIKMRAVIWQLVDTLKFVRSQIPT